MSRTFELNGYLFLSLTIFINKKYTLCVFPSYVCRYVKCLQFLFLVSDSGAHTCQKRCTFCFPFSLLSYIDFVVSPTLTKIIGVDMLPLNYAMSA